MQSCDSRKQEPEESLRLRSTTNAKRRRTCICALYHSRRMVICLPREAEETKQSSREAHREMNEMRDKYIDLLAQLDNLRRYEKHMPEETRRELNSARREALRMIYGDFER